MSTQPPGPGEDQQPDDSANQEQFGGATPPPPPFPPPGANPPPPPPPGYGMPATPPPMPGGPGAQPYSVGNAFSYGWEKFKDNAGVWVLGVLILGGGLFVIQFIYQLIVGGLISTGAGTLEVDPNTGEITGGGGGFIAALIGAFVLAIPMAILGIIVTAQLIRGALGTVDGGKIELGKFFETTFLGPVIVAAIIAGLLTSLGVLACYIGAIVVAFFVQFYAYFVLGDGQGAWESIKSSAGFVKQNVGSIILLFLASMAATFVGALLCGVGLLVAYPVVLIAHAYTFRTLRGEPVAA